jgi:hypothetical protein
MPHASAIYAHSLFPFFPCTKPVPFTRKGRDNFGKAIPLPHLTISSNITNAGVWVKCQRRFLCETCPMIQVESFSLREPPKAPPSETESLSFLLKMTLIEWISAI